jgi:hypothetical protein
MAVSWLKKGKEAHAQVEAADQETAKKQAAGSVRRFWIPKDKETQITFLDGNLDEDGLLETVTFWEHNLRLNGKWGNHYACTQDQEVCPICVGGDTPSLVAAFSIIDHTEWTDKNNKVHKNERRMFVCKRETFKRLQKIATKRDGLAGCTFDVSRTGDKSPSVGSDFDFVEKRTLPQIAKAYTLVEDSGTPFNYEEVLVYRDAAELKQLGFGTIGVGAPAAGGAAPTASDYDNDL